MDLITALKSGKRFRREGHRHWFSPFNYPDAKQMYLDPESKLFSAADILFENWEIEEPKPRIRIFRCIQTHNLRHIGEVSISASEDDHYNPEFWTDITKELAEALREELKGE